VYDIEDSRLHQEMRNEQMKRVQKDSKRNGAGNADRGKGDLDEGAETARPPRVLVLGAGPTVFSAIFSDRGSGGGEGSTVSQVVGGTGVVDRFYPAASWTREMAGRYRLQHDHYLSSGPMV
jgi:hypothetical protein